MQEGVRQNAMFFDNIPDSKDFEKQRFDVWDLLPALDEAASSPPSGI
jgi:hypothetical protein